MNQNTQIVNLHYTVKGFHFDAAIDLNWQLHCYKQDKILKEIIYLLKYIISIVLIGILKYIMKKFKTDMQKILI